ncbi:MAG: radical SAM protein [Chloroflexia bacterium]|nr:radical SAM protein [Chloroflexia bacterium]
MLAFGPVPSRRLGQSLGVNHIPPKTCTYSCVYCQLGRLGKIQVERQAFYEPEQILRAVQEKIEKARQAGERIDYVTFVPDGEPTLDINLGRTIALLRPLGLPIAVISNGSLIGREDVRQDLAQADWVSLKVDAAEEEVWRRVNRGHRKLQLSTIQEEAIEFSRHFQGELVTETMLIAGVNDGEQQVQAVANFLAQLRPAVAYLAIPTRPPAEPWVKAPDEQVVIRAWQVLAGQVEQVEYLIGYEGNAFACTGNVEEDLLSITAVHPMRQEAVEDLLERAGANWSAVRTLIEQDQLFESSYQGHQFYMRKLR